jgi:hypothetical protein
MQLDGLTCNLDTLKCIERGEPVPAEIGGDCEADEGCVSLCDGVLFFRLVPLKPSR